MQPAAGDYRRAVNIGDWSRPERREAARFPVTLSVTFAGGQGWTRDVSATGMFLTTDSALRVGAPIQFTLLLESAEPGAPREVTCEGVVVRVEPRAGSHGVAIRIDSYDIKHADGISESRVFLDPLD